MARKDKYLHLPDKYFELRCSAIKARDLLEAAKGAYEDEWNGYNAIEALKVLTNALK